MNRYVFVFGLTCFLLLIEKYPHQLIPVAFYLVISAWIWVIFHILGVVS